MKKTFLIFILLFLFSFNAFADCTPPPNGPGNDHPDDSYIISTLPAQPPTVLSDAKLTKLMAGYSDQFTNLLNQINTGFIGTDINSDVSTLLSSSKLLVIPSGGLSGLDKSDIFKAVLKEFVNEGGTLVVFAQQHGYEYSALPTPDDKPIQAYGWVEDMSCQYASSYIDTWHQMLSGQTKATPDINVDGYFFGYPSNSTVLLRRTVNSQPDLIAYPCGKGNVIAGTIYSDYASGINQAVGQEKALVRDILTWASNPQTLPEVHPGNPVSINLIAENDTTTDASKVRVTIYDPDRSNAVSTQDFDVTIPAGGSITVPVTFSSNSTSTLGIYHSTFELFDANGNSIKPATDVDSGRFAISNPPQINTQSPDFNFSVQSSAESYVYGSNADFTVQMFNNTTTVRSITAKYFFPHHYCATRSAQYGGDWNNPSLNLTQTLTIPAEGNASFLHELNNVSTYDRLWAYFYDENGNQVGMASRGFYAATANWNTSLALDQTQYNWNHPVHITTTINNGINAAYPIQLELYVKDDKGNQVGYFDYPPLSLSANGSLTQATDFLFSAKPKMGTYFITAKVTSASQSLYTNTSFIVTAPVLSVNTDIPATFNANSVNNAQISLMNNDNLSSDTGVINLTLKGPDGQIAYSSSQNFAVSPLQQQALNFPINPGSLKPGNYQLNYVISRALGDDITYTKNLADSYTYDFSLDKASYKIGDTAVMNLGITNTGAFQTPLNIAISIPDIGYQKNDVINATPGKTFSSYSCVVPNTVPARGHKVNYTISTGSSAFFSGSVVLNVPPSKLVAGQISGPINSGGTITVPVSNTGGVDTTCNLNFLLTDSLGKSVYGNLLTVSDPVNSTQNVALQLPDQLADGYYLASYTITDQKTGLLTSANQEVQIQGLKADIALSTDKTDYLTTDPINGTCTISNTSQNSDTTNANLNLSLNAVNPFGTFNYPPQTYTGFNFIRAVGNDIWLGSGDNYGDYYPGQIAKFDGTNLTIYDSSNTPMPDGASPQCMEIDNSGNLWFGLSNWNGGRGGALKFDGTNWTYYDLSSYIRDNECDIIIKDNSGNLWFGGYWGGLVKYDGTNWTNYEYSTGVAFNEIICGVCDKQGNLWFGTDGNGVLMFNGINWYNFNILNSGLKDNYIESIACDKNGVVYFATLSGNSSYNNGTWATWAGYVDYLYASNITNKVYGFNEMGYVGIYDSGQFISNGTPPQLSPYYADYTAFDITEDSEGNTWFANADLNVIYKFNGLAWTYYSLGMPYNNDEPGFGLKMKIDPTGAYWIGTSRGLGRYFGGVWSNYYQLKNDNNNLDILAIENGKNSEWIASYTTLYNFDGTNWTSYPYSSAGFRFLYPNSLTYESGSDTLWVSTRDWEAGLCSFKNGTWKTFTPYNSGIPSYEVNSVVVDSNGKKWIATGGGLCVYDGQNWMTYNTSNSPMMDNTVTSLAIDHNNAKWIIDQTGAGMEDQAIVFGGPAKVMSYDGTSWTTYDVNAYTYGPIFVDSKNTTWVGTTDGAARFNGTTWDTFNSINSPINGPVRDIAEDANRNAIVLLTDKGLIWYSRGGNGKPVWSTSTNLTIPQNSSSSIPVSISPQSNPGKYYLEGKLTSQSGQTIAVQDTPLYVIPPNLSLEFNADQKIYKTGSTATIQGQVQNNSPISADNIAVKVSTISGATKTDIYSDTISSLSPGSSQPFSITVPCSTLGEIVLSGTVSQNGTQVMTTNDSYEVDSPALTATLTAPPVADNNPFNIGLQLQNTGKVDAVVHLSASGPGLGDQQDITVSSGQVANINYTEQISSDASYTLALTGDLQQILTAPVKYGLSGTMNISSNPVYPEGNVTLPVVLTNTGSMDLSSSVTFNLISNNAKIASYTNSYSLPKGGSFNGSVTFNNLPVGNYQVVASASNPGISGQAAFSVVKAEDVSASVNMGASSGGNVPLITAISNNGYFDFSGTLVIESDFYNYATPINLAAMQKVDNSVNISTAAATPGSHSVTIKLLDLNNQILSSTVKTVSVAGPALTISQLPASPSYAAGSIGALSFHVKNTGDQVGQANLNLKVMDVLDKTETVSLKPGDDIEIPFSFGLPDDLETNDYFADYTLTTGNSQVVLDKGQVKFHIDGIKVDVQASTDKTQYNTGDTAVLTINVNNTNAGAVYNLFARVNYAGYESRQDFTVSDNYTATFNVPLTAITGEKLFYGIYDETGRSIYLNSLYIYQAGQNINVSLDKQVYNPGDVVTATITGQSSGSLTLTAPNYSSTVNFSGNANVSFTLPSPMTAGTYGLTYQLNAADGSVIASRGTPFDVNGYQVKVPESIIDKGKYSPTDTINASLTIDSNSAIPAAIKTWIVDPSGNSTATGETDVNLTTDSNLVQNISVPISTTMAGIHKLVYGVYDSTGLLLCSGSKAFDVGDATLLGLSTDKPDYASNTVPVAVSASIYGSSSAGVELFLDGTSLNSDTVNASSFTDYTYNIPQASLTPGPHSLKAVLTCGGLTSTKETNFVYGSSLPDLVEQLSADTVSGPTVTLYATVINQGKTASIANTLSLYDGDPTSGGNIITTLNVPALEPGGSISIPYQWGVLGSAGNHTVFAVADSGNVVVEFNKNNNTASCLVSVPNLIVGTATSKVSYAANEDVGITVSIDNLTSNMNYAGSSLTVTLTDPAGTVSTIGNNTFNALTPASASSFLVNWNTKSFAPGDYTISSNLTNGANSLASSTAKITVVPTSSAIGSFTTSSAEVIQGFPLSIDYNVTNNGNIELDGGEVEAQLVDGNSVVQATFTQPFGKLLVLASFAQTLNVDKVSVAPGDYTIQFNATAGGATFQIGQKALKVLPPLQVDKAISVIQRVLVLHSKNDDEDDDSKDVEPSSWVYEDALIRSTLDGLGAYYNVVNDAKQFEAELRSGLYNSYILVCDNSNLWLLNKELAERINSGDGLALLVTGGVSSDNLGDLTGIESDEFYPAKSRTLTLLQSPITLPGTCTITGQAEGLRVVSTNAIIAALLEHKEKEREKERPVLVLNQYGQGRVVTFGFEPDSALLGSALSYIKPDKVDVISGTAMPVEINTKSLGTPFDLKVVETVDGSMSILSTFPAGDVQQNTITWQFSLAKDEYKKLLYLCRLPEDKGTFDLSTAVSYLNNNVYEPYNSYDLPVTLDRGVVNLKTDILNSLDNLSVPGKYDRKLREIIWRYQRDINRPACEKEEVDEIISDLAELATEVQALPVDTTAIRLDMDRLMKVYERKWVDLPKDEEDQNW